jgi:hypothetical protein
MRSCFIVIFFITATSTFGGDACGFVQLHSLPPDGFVYVDGRRMHPEEGRLNLKPGWHEVQVEAERGGKVMVARRHVNVTVGRTANIIITLVPVIVPGKVLNPPGPIGPAGVQSPPGPPPFRTAPSPSLDEMYDQLWRQAFDQLHRLSESVSPQSPPLYWYDPHHQTRLGDHPGPPGPSGPPGEEGPPHHRPFVDADGKSVNEYMIQQLGVRDLQRRLEVARPASAVTDVTAWRVQVRNRAFRRELDRQKVAALAVEGQVGIPGPPGPRGPRVWEAPVGLVDQTRKEQLEKLFGPYDKWPEGLKGEWIPFWPVRLSEADIQALLAGLRDDEKLQAALHALTVRVDDYAAWVEELGRQRP